MPLNPIFFGFSSLWVGLVKAPAATCFLFEVFLLLERWLAKVVEFPPPGPGMAIQHLLHPVDARTCLQGLAADASCWCCHLVDIYLCCCLVNQDSFAGRCMGVDICTRKIFSVTSSTEAAVGTFHFLTRLLHHWVMNTNSPLQVQYWGLTVPNNTWCHEKALHRTCCG